MYLEEAGEHSQRTPSTKVQLCSTMGTLAEESESDEDKVASKADVVKGGVNEGEKKKPQYQDGIFYKYTMPLSLAESIKRQKNPDLEKLKAAHVKATNLGPGVSQMTMDTFRLLKNDPIILNSAENKNILAKEGLAAKVDDLVKQRDEFNMQIKEYNDE